MIYVYGHMEAIEIQNKWVKIKDIQGKGKVVLKEAFQDYRVYICYVCT